MATEAASLFVTLTAKSDQYTKAMDAANTRLNGFTNSSVAKTKTISDNFKKQSDTVHWWSRGVKKDTEDATKSLESASRRQVAANRRVQESFKGAASGLIALSAAYKAYSFVKGAIQSTSDLTEQTWKLQSITHQSTKTASTWIETLKSLGISADSTRMGFTTLQRQISAAETGNKNAGKTFRGLGIDMGELKKGNFEKTLLDVSDSLSHMTDKAQVAASAQLLFGRNTTALLPLLTGGRDKVLEALKGTQKFGDYIGGDAYDKLKKFREAQIDFGSAMSGIKIAIGTALIPVLIPVIKYVSNFINQMRTGKGTGGDFANALRDVFKEIKAGFEWVKNLFGGMKNLQTAIKAVVIAILAMEAASAVLFAINAATNPLYWLFLALAAAAYLIIKNWKTVGPFLANLWTNIKAAAQPVVQWLSNAWTNVSHALIIAWQATLPVLEAIWKAIETGVSDSTQWIVNAWNNVKNFLVPIFLAIGKAFAPVISAIIKGVGSLLPTILPFLSAIGNAFKFMFNVIKAIVPPAFKVITTVLAPVITLIKLFAGVIIPLIPKAFQTVWDMIKVILKAIGGIISGFFQTVKGVIEVFTGIFTLDFSKMWKGIKDIFSGAVKALLAVLNGAWNLFYDAGKFIVNAIGSGFKAAFNFVEGLIVGFLNKIIDVLDILPFVNIKHIGGGGGGSKSSQGTGQVTTRAGTYATGGKITQPGYFAGEEAPTHPEYILATNPKYRSRNLGLWAQAGSELGVPGFASGGVVGEVESFMSGAGFNKIGIAGMLGNAMQESTMNPDTPGGGMWQQISNFGSGTGGSLLHQMQVMLPQIAGLRDAMNNAGSPGRAAVIFEQGFEKAGIPALANRVSAAESFYAQLSGKGGGGLFGFLGKAASALAGVVGAGAGALKAMLPSAPKLPGVFSGLGSWVLGKAGSWLESQLGFGGGGGGGPGGTSTFQGRPVANWIIPELEYAQLHGWSGSITSGYRTPAHSASLGFPGDEHTKTSYPGGAVDFGGMQDAAGFANRAAFMRATSGYTGPRLRLPVGFRDDGHMSGTGHFRGGIYKGFANGGAFAGVGHAGSGYSGLDPKPKKHKKPPKAAGTSIHYNWQSGTYQMMTSAQYKALQSLWYSRHPTSPMPTKASTPGATTKGAPALSYHWDWQKQAFEQMTSAQYKALQSAWFKKHPKTRMPTGPAKGKVPTVDQVKVIAAKRKAMIPKGVSKLLKAWGKKETGEPSSFQQLRNIRQDEQNYVDSFNHNDFLPADTATMVNGVWTMEPTDLAARMGKLQEVEHKYLDPAQMKLLAEAPLTKKAVKNAQDRHKSLLKLARTIKAKIRNILKEIAKQQAIVKKEYIAATKAKTSKDRTKHAVAAIQAQNRVNDLTLALGSSTKGIGGDLNTLVNPTSGLIGKYNNTTSALQTSLWAYSDQSKIGDPNSKVPPPVVGFLSIPDRQKTLTDLYNSVHQEMAAVSGTQATTVDNSAALAYAQQQANALQQMYNVSQAQYKVLGNIGSITDLGPLGGYSASNWTTFLGSFATGIANVPMQGLAELHKGEAVIPASQNPFTNGTGMGAEVHLHLHGDADKWVQQVEAVVDGKKAEIVQAANNAIGFKVGTARQTPMSPGRVARY